MHLILKPGLNFTDVELNFPNDGDLKPKFHSATNLRIGLELEVLFPFNDQRWAITLEPAYRSFKASDTITKVINIANKQNIDVEFEHSSIELGIGIKHYINLSPKSRIYIGAKAIPEFILNGRLYNRENKVIVEEYNSSTSLGFSLGYSWNQKISIGARFDTTKNISDDLTNSNMKNFVLVLGYTLF